CPRAGRMVEDREITGNRCRCSPFSLVRLSAQNVVDDVAVDIGQAKVAAALKMGQRLVIDSHEMKQGGVEVVNVDLVFYRVVSELVGGPVVMPSLDPGPGEPSGKAVRIVIASVLVPSGDAVKKFKGRSAPE